MCGSFDNWQTRHELKIDKECGCFQATVPIINNVGSKKIYYKFIVDGEWYTSDEDHTERDEHGNVNNVLILLDNKEFSIEDSELIIISDSDRSSEFTSISHPNSETRWEEIEEGGIDEEVDDMDEDLTASVQITLKDNNSITGSIQSRNNGGNNNHNNNNNKKMKMKKDMKEKGVSELFVGRIRNIFKNK